MFVVRNANESILVVHSNIPVMSFETNMGIIRVDNPDPGEFRLHLHPGSIIVTFKADGYMPVKRTFYIPIKDYREVRVFDRLVKTTKDCSSTYKKGDISFKLLGKLNASYLKENF